MTHSPSPAADSRMPAVFVGHGSPMNAIVDNQWSRGFQRLGQALPRPQAVLCVSAHWVGKGTRVTNNARPRTIHDFGNFPRQLHEMEYPAPGSPELAGRIEALLAAHGVLGNSDWGLDHGTWSVLTHLLPKADVPVVQMSLDESISLHKHLELGRALEPLRAEGVLIVGSGNVVHNLRHAFSSMASGQTQTPAWASDFDAFVEKALEQRDSSGLARALDSDNGRMAHPTAEHYLPLLYVMGASTDHDQLSFPTVGFDAGSLSMRTALFS